MRDDAPDRRPRKHALRPLNFAPPRMSAPPAGRPFRLLAWNVRGSKQDRLADALCAETSVDLFVLSEFYLPLKGDVIGARLCGAGWEHVLYAEMSPGTKGVALFARTPLQPAPDLLRVRSASRIDWAPRLVSARLPDVNLAVVGAYVPVWDGPMKTAVWDALIGVAQRYRDEHVVIAGDFNSCFPADADTGRGYTVEPLQRMSTHAVDLWQAAGPAARVRDQITWAGPNGLGNRIDFVFGTPSVAARLAGAVHRHEFRIAGLSDHSGVMVDLHAAGLA